MSFQALEWAAQQRGCGATAKHLLRVLAHEATTTGEIRRRLTIADLAEELEIGARQVMRAVSTLEEMQLIVVNRGNGRSSTYSLCMGEAVTKSTALFVTGDIADSATSDISDSGFVAPTDATSDISDSGTSDKSDSGTSDISDSGHVLKTKAFKTAYEQQQSARVEESSSTSAEPEIDDDDDLLLPSVPLGLWSKKLYSPQQLRSAARNLGIEHGLDHDWAGYGEWLKSAKAGDLVALLGWLIHYGDLPVAAQRRIESLTAILRTHLKRDERAALNSQQMGYLERYIARSCYSDNLDTYVDELVEETVKRHGGGAWVPADASLFPYGGH